MRAPLTLTPRSRTVDITWATELLRSLFESPLGALEGIGETQIDARFTADDALAIACLQYALGYPMAEVRTALDRSVAASVRVFELRGTTPAFSVEHVTLSEFGEVVARESTGDGQVDASLTNSRAGLRAMEIALAINRRDQALGLARLIGDPVGASYLGPDSVVCTLHEQCVAYALRAFVLGDTRTANAELLRMEGNAQVDIALQSTMLYALIEKKPDFFLERLVMSLDENGSRAAAEPRNPDLLISIPALGMASLALSDALVRKDQLPENPFFPVELL